MKLRELGERAAVRIILDTIAKSPNALLPYGDDVATIKLSENLGLAVTCDMLFQSTDFPKGIKLSQAARKSIIASVSDLAAKGVRPLGFLVSLGVPAEYTEKDLREIICGLEEGAREYNAYILGGDLNESNELVVDCLAFGVFKPSNLISRRGARPGDILAVTGHFGLTSAALISVEKDLELPPKIRDRILSAIYAPKAKLREGVLLAENKLASCAIDSSDGLAMSLYDLVHANNFGFELHKVPVAREAEEFASIHGYDAEELALYGGEEYELIFTVPREKLNQAREIFSESKCQFIEIGVVTESPKVVVRKGEKTHEVRTRGWEHFKR